MPLLSERLLQVAAAHAIRIAWTGGIARDPEGMRNQRERVPPTLRSRERASREMLDSPVAVCPAPLLGVEERAALARRLGKRGAVAGDRKKAGGPGGRRNGALSSSKAASPKAEGAASDSREATSAGIQTLDSHVAVCPAPLLGVSERAALARRLGKRGAAAGDKKKAGGLGGRRSGAPSPP